MAATTYVIYEVTRLSLQVQLEWIGSIDRTILATMGFTAQGFRKRQPFKNAQSKRSRGKR